MEYLGQYSALGNKKRKPAEAIQNRKGRKSCFAWRLSQIVINEKLTEQLNDGLIQKIKNRLQNEITLPNFW